MIADAQTNIRLEVNNKTLTVELASTRAAEQLYADLEKGSITIEMSDYGGFEKVGRLPDYLPEDDRQLTTRPGDIMLYNGRNIVIFYGSNTWAYTPLGNIADVTASSLKQALGTGSTQITLTRVDAGAANIENDEAAKTEPVFDLNGQLVTERPLPNGIYIVGNKKVQIRQ